MKVLSLVFMLLGTFIGAGFVSGREISRYFSSHGIFSYIGIILASILLSILMIFFFKLSHKVNGFNGFINVYFGKCGKIIIWLFSISLVIFSGTMMAGCNEVSSSINISNLIVILLTIVLCFAVVMKSTKGLSLLNLILLPLLLVFLIYVCFSNNLAVTKISFQISTIIDSIFYVFINIVTLGIFILEIGRKYTKKEYIYSVIISTFIIFLIMLIVNNSIQINNLEDEVMPILTLAKLKGNLQYKIMIMFIWVGLFSTLASCVFVLKNILPINLSTNIKCFIILTISVFFSFVKFDMFVNYIYIIIGIIGVLLVFFTLRNEKELNKT